MCALHAVEPGFCVHYMQESLVNVCTACSRAWVLCALYAGESG
jgi:hypothetical protein